MAGYGSAFTPIQRHEVVALIKEVVDYVRDRSEAIVGIHCCGNTDWSMIIEAGPDIVSFDAFSYLDYFFLYPGEIRRFIEGGGTIAWGIVPTFGFTGSETVESPVRTPSKGPGETLCSGPRSRPGGSAVLAHAGMRNGNHGAGRRRAGSWPFARAFGRYNPGADGSREEPKKNQGPLDRSTGAPGFRTYPAVGSGSAESMGTHRAWQRPTAASHRPTKRS